MASFSSCKVEVCKKNNTGDVIVTNNTDETLWFDVTGDDGATAENRVVSPGASTTYTVPSGTAKVWASYADNNDDFVLVNTQPLSQCETINFQTATKTCELFNVTEVKVINSTGYIVYVDLRQNGELYGQRTLYSSEYITYSNIDAPVFRFGTP